MELTPPRTWTTPAPDRSVCVVCREQAYDSADMDSAPWAGAESGDGCVCSPACAYRDAMDWHAGREDVEGCVAAVREALALGVDPGLLEIDYRRAVELGDEDETVIGFAYADHGDTFTFEHPSGEPSSRLRWAGVRKITRAESP